MFYKIRERIFDFGDNFVITDQHDTPIFQVKGKVFSWGDKLSFQDMNDNELAFISQKLLKLMPTYEIQIDGQVFAEVRKEFSWFNKKFTLDVPGPNDYTIDGSFWEHDFTFTRSTGLAAVVSKKHFSWSDSYSVHVQDDEDHLAILCACIVIDQVLHDDKKKR